MDDFAIILIVCVLAVALLIGICIWDAGYQNSKTEIDTYVAVCEITQLDYAEITGKSTTAHIPVYKMGIRNSDFATTLTITPEDYARYTAGELVEVQVTVYEYRDGRQVVEYALLCHSNSK